MSARDVTDAAQQMLDNVVATGEQVYVTGGQTIDAIAQSAAWTGEQALNVAATGIAAYGVVVAARTLAGRGPANSLRAQAVNKVNWGIGLATGLFATALGADVTPKYIDSTVGGVAGSALYGAIGGGIANVLRHTAGPIENFFDNAGVEFKAGAKAGALLGAPLYVAYHALDLYFK